MTLAAIYIFTPVGWDQSVTLASARLAEGKGPFPGNVVQSWMSRGLGYKALFYGLHRVASSAVGYWDKESYERTVRAASVIVIVATLLASVFIGRRFLERCGLGVFDTFFLLSTAHLGLSHWVAFQPEDVGALAAVLGAAMVLSEARLLHVAGGIVLALTFSLKGVTGLIGLSVLPGILAIDPRYLSRVGRAGLAVIVAGAAQAVVALLWFPSELRDVVEMASFGRSPGVDLALRIKVMLGMLASWPHVPALVAGGLCTAAVTGFLVARHRWRQLGFLLAAWLLAFVGPFVQAKGFAYHAASMLPLLTGSILTCTAWMTRAQPWRRWALVPLLLVPAAVVPGLLGQPMGRFQRPSALGARLEEVRKERRQLGQLAREFDLPAEPVILYLDWGLTTYYWGAPSHLRHFIPLPLQRSSAALRDLEAYGEDLEDALRYSGRYVALNTEWFPLDRPDLSALRRKLEKEYVPVGMVGPVRLLRRTAS